MTASIPENSHVYYPAEASRWVYKLLGGIIAAAGVLLLVLSLFMTATPSAFGLVFMIGLVLLLAGLAGGWINTTKKLVVSDEGVFYEAGWITHQVAWKKMERIAPVQDNLCIVFDKSPVGRKPHGGKDIEPGYLPLDDFIQAKTKQSDEKGRSRFQALLEAFEDSPLYDDIYAFHPYLIRQYNMRFER